MHRRGAAPDFRIALAFYGAWLNRVQHTQENLTNPINHLQPTPVNPRHHARYAEIRGGKVSLFEAGFSSVGQSDRDFIFHPSLAAVSDTVPTRNDEQNAQRSTNGSLFFSDPQSPRNRLRSGESLPPDAIANTRQPPAHIRNYGSGAQGYTNPSVPSTRRPV